MSRQPHFEKAPGPEWSPCPPGELARLGQRLQARRQRRLFLCGVAATTLVTTGGGLFAWLGFRAAHDLSFADLTCTQVHELAGAYARGELSASQRRQVRQHLVQCPRCGPWAKNNGLLT
jgi:hypothetical protein